MEEASVEQLVEKVDNESMHWLLNEWENCSYAKKKEVFDRFFEETETKIQHHAYGSRDDILKDQEILKALLLKIDDFKKRIKVDCLKVQLKYHRAMIGKAKIDLILCDIFNTYKDYMLEEHKAWMMEKNIHVMTRDDISELILNLGRSVGGYKYELRQCGAEVLKEPKEKVQMKNSSVIQVIERNREEYMLLEKKIGCLLIEMYKASEPYKPGGQVKHTLHGYIREAERILGLLWDELKALGNPGYAQPPAAQQQGYCSHIEAYHLPTPQPGYYSQIGALPPAPQIASVQPPTLAGIGSQQLNSPASFPPQGSVQTSYGIQPGLSSLAQAGYGHPQGIRAAYHQEIGIFTYGAQGITGQMASVQPPTLSGIGSQHLNNHTSFPQGSVQTSYGSQLGPSPMAQTGYGPPQGIRAVYDQMPPPSSTRTGSFQPFPMQSGYALPPSLSGYAQQGSSHYRIPSGYSSALGYGQAPPYDATQPATQPRHWQAPPYYAPQPATQPVYWQSYHPNAPP